MPDWKKSMKQTFEYYTVDPGTWKDVKKLDTVKSCSISRDSTVATLGSATIDIDETVGECYIRVYLVTNQNGIVERFPLGTFLVQTPSSTFDGRVLSTTMDAYTPLLELKEKQPPLGYSVLKGENIMKLAKQLVAENARAPVAGADCTTNIYSDFVANAEDTWLTFLTDFIANAKYRFALDELGRILFAPRQELDSLQPVWTFDDGNSSIIQPEFDIKHDLYGIPNAVEVIYSNGRETYHVKVVNDDDNSPVSTVVRGREIPYRVTDPGFSGEPSESQVREYAETLLKQLSTLEYIVSFTHGYCPVRTCDCVRIKYPRAGLPDIKAEVLTQDIKCEPGCQVKTTARFTMKLWR
jgi:hypothetical protein